MTRFVSIAALGLLTLALSSCGGSSSCGPLTSSGTCTSNPGGGGGGPTVASVTVSSSAASVPPDGTSTATITVLVKDANNNVLANVAVTLAASAGAIAAGASNTDASGKVTATLSGAGVATGTSITVTATAGGVSGHTGVMVAAVQRSISVVTGSAQIPSDNSKAATITAVVRDANNNLVAGIPVTFQASTGAVAAVQTLAGASGSVPAGTTDVNGAAAASLTTPGDPSDRTITVTASAGTASAQVTVGVTGTSLTLAAPASLVLGSSANGTVALANSAGQGIPNATVMLASANGNTLSAPSVTTDNTGHATFTITGAHGGNDTITATGLGLTQNSTVSVSTQNFAITAPAANTQVNLGASQTVTVTWLSNGVAVSGQTVTFAATRGTLAPSTPVTTDANGIASVSISSNGAGPSIISASGNNGSAVSAQINLDFVAQNPTQISVQAGPAAVAVQGQSTITALVRDANNNFVQGATVDFQLVSDPTNGSLSTASTVTNIQGQAQTTYTAGNTSSGANGVTVAATIGGTSVSANTTLSVGGQTVFLTVGTGNSISTEKDGVTYDVVYSIFAVDSHGAAVPNVPVTVSMLPVAYGKGGMGNCPSPGPWEAVYSTAANDQFAWNGYTLCRNEDTDYTGNINSGGFCPSGSTTPCKDYNKNGKLDPGNVAVVSPSSGTTDASGHMDVTVSYPKDHAYWVEVQLVASATVQGTQSSTSTTFLLQGAVADYACNVAPPGIPSPNGVVSPYGTGNTCANPN